MLIFKRGPVMDTSAPLIIHQAGCMTKESKPVLHIEYRGYEPGTYGDIHTIPIEIPEGVNHGDNCETTGCDIVCACMKKARQIIDRLSPSVVAMPYGIGYSCDDRNPQKMYEMIDSIMDGITVELWRTESHKDDLFEDVKNETGCEYISDLPREKEMVEKALNNINLENYPKPAVKAFFAYTGLAAER